jgi:hypothetical protein
MGRGMKKLLECVIFALVVASWLIPTIMLGICLGEENLSAGHFPLVGKALVMVLAFVFMGIIAGISKDAINYHLERNNWFGFFDSDLKGRDGILHYELCCLAIFNLLSVTLIMMGLGIYYAGGGIKSIASRLRHLAQHQDCI